MEIATLSLRENCLYSEFSRTWTEYEKIRITSPYSVQMRDKADQNKSEHGHFLRSDGKPKHNFY